VAIIYSGQHETAMIVNNAHGGTGKNLKVGGPVRRKAPEKKFCGRAPPLFGSKSTIVVLVSAFVMVSTVWSVSCLLFFYSRCPQCPAICKSGGGGSCLMDSAQLWLSNQIPSNSIQHKSSSSRETVIETLCMRLLSTYVNVAYSI